MVWWKGRRRREWGGLPVDIYRSTWSASLLGTIGPLDKKREVDQMLHARVYHGPMAPPCLPTPCNRQE